MTLKSYNKLPPKNETGIYGNSSSTCISNHTVLCNMFIYMYFESGIQIRLDTPLFLQLTMAVF